MSLKYWPGSHTKHRLLFHIVWLPKYRKKVLYRKVASRLRNILYDGAKINDWWIDELEVMPDHVHILIQIRPTDSVANVVKILKGGSSKILRKEFPDLDVFIWGDSFWATGYFAESVGRVSYDTVKKYIQDQDAKYATD